MKRVLRQLHPPRAGFEARRGFEAKPRIRDPVAGAEQMRTWEKLIAKSLDGARLESLDAEYKNALYFVCSEFDALRAEVAALKNGGDAHAQRRRDIDPAVEPTHATPPPVGKAGGAWRRFPDELPPERHHVLVRLTEIPCGDPSGLGGIPASVAGGYLRFSAGDKDSPYFVTPGVNQTARRVTHWCDCLPEWMQRFDYAQRAENHEAVYSASRDAFRLVHFSPSPWNGLRWPMGALIRRDGQVIVVLTPMVPDEATIGGPAAAALLRMLSKRLQAATEFDALPVSMGPHVSLDVVRFFPGRVDDLGSWVMRTLPGGEAQPVPEPDKWHVFPSDDEIRAHRLWWRLNKHTGKPQAVDLRITGDGFLVDDSGEDSPPLTLRGPGQEDAASFRNYLTDQWQAR